MAYTALYRKFRPQTFEELVGQEHIVRTLLNQMETGRIAHAYLFAGPRGTGKTSTAKLFARAINCSAPKNGNPCGECEACKAYSADDNMDIIEIDAASNNGVDNIRDIRDKVVFTPAYGKYKVYIIDEVHMLSPGAFNALLKTLEEPPKHIVFILATTEIHKIPATILSRCQRFDFKLISAEIIASRIEYALKESNVVCEKEAIDLIAKSANGGMRDALSLADVCISYCGNNISLADVRGVLGISDRNFVFDFAQKIIESDCKGILEKCRELENEGKDIGVFALELMEHLRDIMLCIYSPECEEINTLPKEIKEKLIIQAKSTNSERIVRGIEILSSLEKDIKLHNRPDIQLETAAVRMCMPEVEKDILALNDRVEKLEKKLAGANISMQPKTQHQEQIREQNDVPWEENTPYDVKDTHKEKAEPKREIPVRSEAPKQTNPAPSSPASQADGIWKVVAGRIQQTDVPFYLMIRKFDGAIEDDKFVIYVPEKDKNKLPLVEKNINVFTQIVEEIKGQPYKIEIKIGMRPAGGEQNNDMMKAALDLFS